MQGWHEVKQFDKTKFYLGTLCNHGHDYDGIGKSLRYLSGKCCIKCMKISSSLYFKKNKKRSKERHKKYQKENKEKYNEYSKKFYKENTDKCIERSMKYHKENKERINENQKKYRKENRDKAKEHRKKYLLALSKNYVKRQISLQLNIETDKISPEMIELKREQLMIYREIKQFKKEINDGIITG